MRLPHSIKLIKVALIASLSLELLGFILPSYALEGDVVRPYASMTYLYDDNLRRFSSKEQAKIFTGSEKLADTMRSTEVGIILDKKISLQSFFVDFAVNQSKFDKNSALDSNGRELNAKWNWHLGNFWQGNLQAYHKKSMVPFSDFRAVGGLGLNMRTEERKIADAVWKLHPRWQSRVAFVNYKVEYSSESQRVANLDENSQELEFDYISPSASKIGVVYRHARGERPVDQIFFGIPVSNDYTQNEIKLNVDWSLSGKTKFQFLGGLVDRRHDEISERDFRKFNARATLNWLPTGKTGINLATWKENNAQSFVTSSYTANTGASLSASIYATSKVTFQGSMRYEKREFEGDDFFGQSHSFTDKAVTLGLVYRPTLALVFNAAIVKSIRDASVQGSEFDSNSLSLTGQYEF